MWPIESRATTARRAGPDPPSRARARPLLRRPRSPAHRRGTRRRRAPPVQRDQGKEERESATLHGPEATLGPATQGRGSIGRAPVSKTGGCRFESCRPCRRAARSPNGSSWPGGQYHRPDEELAERLWSGSTPARSRPQAGHLPGRRRRPAARIPPDGVATGTSPGSIGGSDLRDASTRPRTRVSVRNPEVRLAAPSRVGRH